jgi:hypothetical protein
MTNSFLSDTIVRTFSIIFLVITLISFFALLSIYLRRNHSVVSAPIRCPISSSELAK